MTKMIKARLARRAVKTTAKHTAHGAASKLKRDPARTSTLLALGCAVGVAIGWAAGNRPAAHLSPQA
jgi:hypothetical protein